MAMALTSSLVTKSWAFFSLSSPHFSCDDGRCFPRNVALGGISLGFGSMKEGNDGSFPKDPGLVTKERRGYDVLSSGVKG